MKAYSQTTPTNRINVSATNCRILAALKPSNWFRRSGANLPFLLFSIVVALLFSSPVHSDEKSGWNWGTTHRLYRFPGYKAPSSWDSSCSQYVAAFLLQSIGHDVDKEWYDEIGKTINADQTGVHRPDLVKYLQRYLQCDVHDHATLSTVIAHLQAGYPVVAMVEPGPGSTHSVILTGYATSQNGHLSHVFLQDNGVSRGVYSYLEFAKMWSCPGHSRTHNYCILIRPKKAPSLLEKLSGAQILANTSALHDRFSTTRHLVTSDPLAARLLNSNPNPLSYITDLDELAAVGSWLSRRDTARSIDNESLLQQQLLQSESVLQQQLLQIHIDVLKSSSEITKAVCVFGALLAFTGIWQILLMKPSRKSALSMLIGIVRR